MSSRIKFTYDDDKELSAFLFKISDSVEDIKVKPIRGNRKRNTAYITIKSVNIPSKNAIKSTIINFPNSGKQRGKP